MTTLAIADSLLILSRDEQTWLGLDGRDIQQMSLLKMEAQRHRRMAGSGRYDQHRAIAHVMSRLDESGELRDGLMMDELLERHYCETSLQARQVITAVYVFIFENQSAAL